MSARDSSLSIVFLMAAALVIAAVMVAVLLATRRSRHPVHARALMSHATCVGTHVEPGTPPRYAAQFELPQGEILDLEVARARHAGLRAGQAGLLTWQGGVAQRFVLQERPGHPAHD